MAIGSVDISAFNAQTMTAQDSKGVQTTSFAHMAVTVNEDPVSALADSAEELTFSKDNSRQTKLADRKQKSSATRQQELIEKLKKVQDIQFDDESAQKRTLRTWKSKGGKNPNELLKLLRDLGSSNSSIYAFLQKSIDDDENSDIKDSLKAVAEDFFKANKSEITAFVNSLEATGSSSFARGVELSETYAEFCASSHDSLDFLGKLINKYGKEHVKEGIDIMFKALACDLASVEKSLDDNSMADVASALTRVRTLNASFIHIDRFATRVGTVLNLDNTLNSSKLFSDLMHAASGRFVTSVNIHQCYKNDVKTPDPEKAVLVCQELYKAVREFPIELFATLEDRNKLTGAVQKLLDELIEKEDEWLDSMGQ